MTWRSLSLGAAGVLLLLQGCVEWRVQWVTPAKVVELEAPTRLRAVLRDSQLVSLSQPSVTADSLLGVRDGKRWSAPLSEVVYVFLPRSDPAGSVMLVSGALVLTLIAVGIGVAANMNW